MNKKGFTLIEGLMVIAIIGVILLTLIPSVIAIINKNKEKNFESTRDSIITAAEMYVAENKYNDERIPIDCSNGKTEVYIDLPLETLSGYGNLSTIPEGFPDVKVRFDCQEKNFSYKYAKEEAAVPPDYSSLTQAEIKENTANTNDDGGDTGTESGNETSNNSTITINRYLNETLEEVVVSNYQVTSNGSYHIEIESSDDYDTYDHTSCSKNDVSITDIASYYTVDLTIGNINSEVTCDVYFTR